MASLIDTYEQIMSHTVFMKVLPALNILIGVGAVTLNTFTGWFFKSRSRNVMHLVYLSLSCSDFVAGAAALIQGISLIYFTTSPDSLGYTGPVFYTLSQVALHTSIVYSVMLTIIRSLNIRFRFYRLNRRAALAVTFLVPMFWSVLVLSELLLTNLFLYPPHMRHYGTTNHTIALIKDLVVYPRPGGAMVFSIMCRTAIASTTCNSHNTEILMIFINLVLPYGLPILVCLASTVYQTYHLIFKRKSRVTQTNRRMTQTIVILTIVSLICNSAYFLTALSTRNKPFNEVIGLVQCTTSYTVLYLHSFITPLVLCVRGKTLNKYVKGVMSMKRLIGPESCRAKRYKHTTPKVLRISQVVKPRLRAEKRSDECLIETII